MKFSTSPEEFLHFNRFHVERTGAFFELCLWFQDPYSGSSLPVFRGMIWKDDFKGQVDSLKKYIARVGIGSTDDQQRSRMPLWNTAPIAFNHLDCVRRGEYAEIVIRNFSHKFALDASSRGTVMTGTTTGAYISEASVHRLLVLELIQKSEPPSKS